MWQWETPNACRHTLCGAHTHDHPQLYAAQGESVRKHTQHIGRLRHINLQLSACVYITLSFLSLHTYIYIHAHLHIDPSLSPQSRSTSIYDIYLSVSLPPSLSPLLLSLSLHAHMSTYHSYTHRPLLVVIYRYLSHSLPLSLCRFLSLSLSL